MPTGGEKMLLVHTQRRLLWHGVFLLLLGLLTGAVIPYFTNTRMGLSAHLTGVLNGMVLVLFGLIWRALRLSARMAQATFWLATYAMYAIFAALLLAAVLGTSGVTPIAGAGYAGTVWQETLVSAMVASGSAAIVMACGLTLYGLRRPDATER
jgi:hydroxylaminobenzene mutase